MTVFFQLIHQSVERATIDFLNTMRRRFYVTPTSYLELLSTFKKLLAEKYQAGGMGYGEAKKSLLGKINTYFEAARIKRKEFTANPGIVEEILREGARKARAEARAT